MNAEFLEALRQIEREKEIPFETLIASLEKALASAYKRTHGIEQEVKFRLELPGATLPGRGLRLFMLKTVSDEVYNPYTEITRTDARNKFKPDAEVGDVVEEVVADSDFAKIGRIAAQTAKQVMQQDIRERERDKVFDEYYDRIGDVISGTVSRREGGNVIVLMGKLEVVLPIKEQVPTERYHFNDRLKFFILDVRKTNKGPQVIVSRTHPSLIRRLFEMEVPEIHDAVVSIKFVGAGAGAALENRGGLAGRPG